MKKISERNPIEVENSIKRAKNIAKIREFCCNGNNMLFSEKLGVSLQYASSLCNGKERVTEKTLEKILTAFPEVSRAWLYFGEGNMLKSDNSAQHGTFGENNGIIVQHGGGGDTYNNQSNAELIQLVVSQQKTIHELTEQNKILTQIIKERI